MGMLTLVRPHGAFGGSCTLLLARSGALQAYLPPQPLHSLVIHHPALTQKAIGHAAVPADVFGRDP